MVFLSIYRKKKNNLYNMANEKTVNTNIFKQPHVNICLFVDFIYIYFFYVEVLY